ncbi:MAG: sulfite exporter TauE/SafE family protein [bacterium]
MPLVLICIALGLAAGALSGLVGLGGGIVVLPVLIYALGMEQHLAQGTTLAMMLPPIGVLAVWNYYKHGYVDFKVAMLICLGFLIGAFFGSKMAVNMDTKYIKTICGVSFILVGIKMAFFKN